MVGIVRPDVATFLPRDQDGAAIRERLQYRRRCEVLIRPKLLRTIFGALLARATDQPGIVLCILHGPENFPGIQIERENGIGGFRGGFSVGGAGADVECVAFRINCWRQPDPGARWTPALHSIGILSGRLRRFRNRIGLPDLAAIGSIQRDHAAAKRAARISFVGPRAFFAR